MRTLLWILALTAAPTAVWVMAGEERTTDIPRVRQMPSLPEPLVVRDWPTVARQYYELVLDPERRLDGKPLSAIDTNRNAFRISSYVGREPGNEAMTCLSVVVGARLAGLNPRKMSGFDFVEAAKAWFDERHGIYRHSPGQRGQPVVHAGVYGYWPAIQGLMLIGQYPDDPDFAKHRLATANAFLRIARGMGCPEKPNFDVLGYNFDTGCPDGRPEPMNRLGHAPSVAWALLVGHGLTGNRQMLDCARAALQWHIDHPGRYEVTHLMGPLTAARLNAEFDCQLDLGRALAAWFGEVDAERAPWKITAGTRAGGLTCDGLDGAHWGGREPGFHAFAMGTLQGPAWLVPVARYEPRYARDIGRYALHAAASARLLQGYGLDADHQDHLDWKQKWDPTDLLFYEALTSWDWSDQRKFRPYATGDPVRLGWGVPKVAPKEYLAEKQRWFSRTPHNLALYMGNHVGFLGGIMRLTDVPGVLRWDCVATDWYHPPAHPSFLFYNPHPTEQRFAADFGDRPVDLYNSLADEFIRRNVRGRSLLTLPPDAAAVIVAVPAGSHVKRDGRKVWIDGVVVKWR